MENNPFSEKPKPFELTQMDMNPKEVILSSGWLSFKLPENWKLRHNKNNIQPIRHHFKDLIKGNHLITNT